MFKHIHIIGSGAIGSLLAAKAQKDDLIVTRHLRSRAVESVTLLDNNIVELQTLKNYWPQNQTNDCLIILPLKSYQISNAVIDYVDQFPLNSAVVLLHNGMGCYEQVADLLSEHFVYLATTSHGAYKPSPTACIHTGVGNTMVGAAGFKRSKQNQQEVIQCLQSWLSPTYWQLNIHSALWQKLAINALINPLTALKNIKNGELSDQKYLALLTHLAAELSLVAGAEKNHLPQTDILKAALEVIDNTANNYSSMHQDMKHGRQTEIDAITGFVLACANKHGIACPHHQALFDDIKGLAAD